MLAAVAASAGGCGRSGAASGGGGQTGRTVTGMPVAELRAALYDSVTVVSADSIRWWTTWRLCWDPHAGSLGYQLEALTAGGGAGALQRTNELCYSVEVASGINPREQGLHRREELITLQARRLAVRVRAELPDGRVTPWSEPVALGARHPPLEREQGGWTERRGPF